MDAVVCVPHARVTQAAGPPASWPRPPRPGQSASSAQPRHSHVYRSLARFNISHGPTWIISSPLRQLFSLFIYFVTPYSFLRRLSRLVFLFSITLMCNITQKQRPTEKKEWMVAWKPLSLYKVQPTWKTCPCQCKKGKSREGYKCKKTRIWIEYKKTIINRRNTKQYK